MAAVQPRALYVQYRTAIRVRASFRALHRWAQCPHEDVAFLRDYHRHVFQVSLSVSVVHDDRDVEFFQLQEKLQQHCGKWEGQKVDMSCEMFCKDILFYFLALGFRAHSVTVSEDGENSATVTVANDKTQADSVMLNLVSNDSSNIQP